MLGVSVTIDSEQGAGATGSVLFGAPANNATTDGVETLAIDVADAVGGGGTDGNVSFGNVGVGTRLGALSVTAGGAISLAATAVSVSAAVTNFSGIINATAINTQLISAQTYTPGLGNLI